MAKNLLIVESPAKAKTIEKFLGKDFEVVSSFGHIRDLAKGDDGVDIANGFLPQYVVSEDKIKVVKDLRAKAKKATEVWLASDEDREGESISWHLAEVLGLDPATTKRIVFHEITKPAIQKAVTTPRVIDMNLVDAQQARRILDRIVGFELSPVLWKKVGMQRSLSAGRVQSVAVRLIVEREREINVFQPESSFKIEAFFEGESLQQKPIHFKAESNKKIKTEKDAITFLDTCKGAQYTVTDVEVKPTKRTPAAPFTTSTLQQEASRKLGYGVSKTMLLAQKLYENGYITYMRTDSVSLSETALADIQREITNSYGSDYYKLRHYKNKSVGAQEAHEAIRPTYMSNHTIDEPDAKKLYELIWKRTIASQMSDAAFEKTVATIDISTNHETLIASGEVLKFDGFLKVYLESKDEEEEENDSHSLPPLNKGQRLALQELKATEKFTKPAARYTEASLVKKLEELGIGRPSTYAPTISTIMKRNYVEKRDKEGVERVVRIATLTPSQEIKTTSLKEITGREKAKLFPTDLGMVVTDFLIAHFDGVMDYGFTARVEADFDKIAEGKLVWNKMLSTFYTPFHQEVAHTMETAERAKGERELGIDPASDKKVVARMGRYGPMVQIGDAEDEQHPPRFASLRKEQSIETITLEEALDLFKLPLELGVYEDREVSVNTGRYGPYVKWGETFISLPRNTDPLTIDIEQAISIIEAKKEADAPIGFYENKPVTKGKGRFGPFIKWDSLYVNVPKAYDFERLTQKDIDELISKKLEKEANRYIQQWEKEKISIENGRWGPFIHFGKLMLKLGKNSNGEKHTPETLKHITLEEVKQMIEAQVPDAFSPKAKKSSTTKKAATKKGKTK